ncbi:Tim44/TimA family putative adaptor protein [Falsirhodobacter sp. 20TX0035]|uniref:Tim44/TimA family putative adaptor protein n=1 Tax=Falsirhodobacter sp. 20TX0035 TaxID=3022019 RepID=UPI00232FB614|nr:Tim44/TimA family putative adaptor protein [Falsirhodobacter sp. 20TX0035]MDB6452768.1 Tim44/TimA family putative adaptor protein [Falsirhodobacter sp. 20TX0035]
MSSSTVIQLLVLAAIAVFLILKLRSVLGTRTGYEKPPVQPGTVAPAGLPRTDVAEGGPDRDITDHVPETSDSARAFAAMKRVEPSFSVAEFLTGARGAYEMILLAFDRGDLDSVKGFIAPEVHDAFAQAVEARRAQGLTVHSNIIGIRELAVNEATFSDTSRIAEITVRFMAEMTTVVKNAAGEVVEGSETETKRQRDLWTFQRAMGAQDPNWRLVATGE